MNTVSSSQQIHPPSGGLAVREDGRSFSKFDADAWRELLAKLTNEADLRHAESLEVPT